MEARFEAFFNPDEADTSVVAAGAKDFYALLQRMSDAIRARSVPWADYPAAHGS